MGTKDALREKLDIRGLAMLGSEIDAISTRDVGRCGCCAGVDHGVRTARFLWTVRKDRVIMERVEHEERTSARWIDFRGLGCRTNLNQRRPIGLQ